jgi:hypothetical protein
MATRPTAMSSTAMPGGLGIRDRPVASRSPRIRDSPIPAWPIHGWPIPVPPRMPRCPLTGAGVRTGASSTRVPAPTLGSDRERRRPPVIRGSRILATGRDRPGHQHARPIHGWLETRASPATHASLATHVSRATPASPASRATPATRATPASPVSG